jgi:hypothetical protein
VTGGHINVPNVSQKKRNLTIEVSRSKDPFSSLLVTPILSWSPCRMSKSKGKENELMDRTVSARIIGPGKVPEASVVLAHGEH